MTKQIFEPACIPCILNQGLNSAKLFGITDKKTQLIMLNEIMSEILNYKGNLSGPLFSSTFQSIMKKYSKSDNPYKLIKEKNLEQAKQYIPYLSEMIRLSEDKIEMAIRAAILGNTIDLGANPNYNLEDEVNKISSNNIA
ncbi:MAG: DUF89 family protein, partial [Ignavibacteriales bacterium]|nr:DUF89 family protein [Ignavibacteriales bacterium]